MRLGFPCRLPVSCPVGLLAARLVLVISWMLYARPIALDRHVGCSARHGFVLGELLSERRFSYDSCLDAHFGRYDHFSLYYLYLLISSLPTGLCLVFHPLQRRAALLSVTLPVEQARSSRTCSISDSDDGTSYPGPRCNRCTCAVHGVPPRGPASLLRVPYMRFAQSVPGVAPSTSR